MKQFGNTFIHVTVYLSLKPCPKPIMKLCSETGKAYENLLPCHSHAEAVPTANMLQTLVTSITSYQYAVEQDNKSEYELQTWVAWTL